MGRWLAISLVSVSLFLVQSAAYSKATVPSTKKQSPKLKTELKVQKTIHAHEVEAKASEPKQQSAESVTEIREQSSVLAPETEITAPEGALYTTSDEAA